MATRKYDESQAQRRARQRQEERAEEEFAKHRSAATSYGAQLRALARQVSRIIEAHGPYPKGEPIPSATLARIREAMGAYSLGIAPWAKATTWRMISEVNRRNKTAWEKYTQGMGQELRRQLQTAPIGAEVDQLMASQVQLITSLPLEAAQYVHQWSLRAMEEGHRAATQVERIAGQLAVSPSAAFQEAWENATDPEAFLINRATLIARTETARAASVLTQARAKHIGAESYIWKTAGDYKVRPSHRRLAGTVQRWDDPPLSDLPDYHSHPGQVFNCRCLALPIIPT